MGPATFSLGEMEAERAKELEFTMVPNDMQGRAQQHSVSDTACRFDNTYIIACFKVNVTVTMKPTRFRLPFTYWPARATTTQTDGDFSYTPCYVLPSPSALRIRTKVEEDGDGYREIQIQYQYVVDAMPLGPATVFLAVVLQGPEEMNLNHIMFGQVALLQVTPCPAKQLCALIRDRVALSVSAQDAVQIFVWNTEAFVCCTFLQKDRVTIVSALQQVPATLPVATTEILDVVNSAMLGYVCMQFDSVWLSCKYSTLVSQQVARIAWRNASPDRKAAN